MAYAYESWRETNLNRAKFAFVTYHHNSSQDDLNYIIIGLAGDIHFNDDKYFTVNSYKGKNLPWVALHEIGHSIGMEHSKVKNSIMYPYYQSYNGHESDLSTDDITGIQALYGKCWFLTITNWSFSIFMFFSRYLFYWTRICYRMLAPLFTQ